MKTLLTFCALFFAGSQSFACDACGCGAGGNYMGILPQFNSNFIGLRLNSRSFETLGAPSLLQTESDTRKQERFETMDLWVRFQPGKRWQVYGYLPYQRAEAVHQGEKHSRSGLGDASAMLNYTVLGNADSLLSQLKYTWQLSAALKAPTAPASGHSTAEDSVLGPAFNPGTRSWDYTLGSILTLRKYVWGISTDVFYRVNGQGAKNYTFGNRFNASIRGFYWKNWGRYTLLPNAGILFEHNGKEVQNGVFVTYSGGSAYFAMLGIENYFKNWSFGCTYQHPIRQELAQGRVKAGPRAQLTLAFIIPNKKSIVSNF